MSSTIDGGGWDEIEYNIDLKFEYKGLYSKFVDEIYFRGEHHLITEYGFSIKSDYTKYRKYSFYKLLSKYYLPEHIELIDIDKLIYDELLKKSDVNITEEDLIMCIREKKLSKLKKQMKKEKSISYRVKKFFKKKL